MVKSKSKFKASKSVTEGRPPLAKSQKPALSSKVTRTLIRSHHNLQKTRAAALAAHDEASVALIDAQTKANGGLESYQLASTLGQSTSRGGDSSKVMVEWLKPIFDTASSGGFRLHMLEIGALSTQNTCSKISCLDIDRIDLRAQVPGIREIDFMDLRLPETEIEKYHIISLSLVLNFVPEASARGEMLQRIPECMRRPTPKERNTDSSYLFFVLPLPCIVNSRYMTESLLTEIMASLGLVFSQSKKTSKLYYSMWKYDPDQVSARSFRKEEMKSGTNRNNFAIVIA